MITINLANDKEMMQAIYNCYPCKFAKFNAMIYYKRFGVFPLNLDWYLLWAWPFYIVMLAGLSALIISFQPKDESK